MEHVGAAEPEKNPEKNPLEELMRGVSSLFGLPQESPTPPEPHHKRTPSEAEDVLMLEALRRKRASGKKSIEGRFTPDSGNDSHSGGSHGGGNRGIGNGGNGVIGVVAMVVWW